jgi:hypothetical protein
MFHIQNGLKQGEVLLPLIFNFPLAYSTRKVQGNQVGVKQNGTYQLLVCADNINLVGYDKNTIRSLIDACKEVGLKVNTEKSKHSLMSHHQNAGKNHNRRTANRYSENVAKLKYLGMTVTNQTCYHSVQNLLSSHLPSKLYKIIIFPVVLYGCEISSLTLREGEGV